MKRNRIIGLLIVILSLIMYYFGNFDDPFDFILGAFTAVGISYLLGLLPLKKKIKKT